MQGVLSRSKAVAGSGRPSSDGARTLALDQPWPLYGVYLGAAWTITRIYWHTTQQLDVANLARFGAGTAEAPFAYRVLMPWTLRGLSALNGTNDLVLTDIGLRVLVLFGLMLLLRRWMRHFVPPVLADTSPLLLGVLLPGAFDWYWPYDFAGILFWTACLLALVERRYKLFFALLVLGAFNRETIAFLVGIFAVTQWHTLGPRRTLLGSAAQLGAVLAVLVGLRLVVHPHGGQPVEIHFAENLLFLVGANHTGLFENWMLLLSTLGFTWMLAIWHWRAKSLFLRRACYLVPAAALATLVAGRVAEVRIWTEWIPIALALAGQTLMEFSASEQEPRRELAPQPQ